MFRRIMLALPLLAATAAAPAFAQGCDTRFSIANQSSAVVEQFYFGPSSNPNWGADQLGRNVLPQGRSLNYQAARGGMYDFKVIWSNGRTAEIRQVDICRASRITVTDRGLIAQ